MKKPSIVAAGLAFILVPIIDRGLSAGPKPGEPYPSGVSAGTGVQPPGPGAAPEGARTNAEPETITEGHVVHSDESASPPPEVKKEIALTRAAQARAQSLRQGARAHPEEISYQVDLLSGFIQMDMIDEALLAAPELVKAFPKSSELFLLFGRALARDGSSDLARLKFQRAIALDETNAGAYIGTAKIDLMRGDFKSAEAGFRKALALDPARGVARGALAGMLEMTGRYAEAIDTLTAPSKKGGPKGDLSGRHALLPEFIKDPPLVLPSGFTSVTLPFKTLTPFPPLISIKLGAGIEKLFVVDTGSDEVLLTSDTAKELGLPEKGKTTLKDEEGREYPTPAYLVLDHMTLGGVTVRRVPARVAPGINYPRRQIAGALGREFLRKFRTVIDYPAKTITLGRAGGPPLDGVPFELAGAILIEGLSGERTMGKFVLDTSSYTPAPMDVKFVATETGLTMFSPEVKAMKEGPHIFTFTMPHLGIGGVDFTGVSATAVDLRLVSKQLGVNVHGILGHSLLRECRLEIDLANQRLTLKRVAAAAPKVPAAGA